MSVIVKGMGMPKNCDECGIRDIHLCKLWMRMTISQRIEGKHPDCPLVEVKEPHGRLIDATFEENHYASMLLNPTPDVTEQDKHKARIIIEALRMAKTVIEAEERRNEQ